MYYNSLLVLHEVNHILSFSPTLFETFIDSAGNPIPLEKTTKTKIVNGVSRKLLTTPRLIATAKRHFNCKDIDGLELENQGGAGTAGAHWEMRLMAGDFMIGESYAENVISDMSLALMEDSGWYKVNYYTGGLFRFGKNAGCDFLNTKCVVDGKTKFPNDYATFLKASQCFAGRTNKGFSSIVQGVTIDPNYQYFSDPKWGGNPNSDYCPIAIDYSDINMQFAYSCLMGKTTLPASLAEKIGNDSNCFISSLTPQNDNSISDLKGSKFGICYETTCNDSEFSYTVKIGASTLKCEKAGGPVTLSGWDGTFECPDYNLVCTRKASCGDTFDCISKKVTALTANYKYDSSLADTSDALPEIFNALGAGYIGVNLFFLFILTLIFW
jgi:leishmanolysin